MNAINLKYALLIKEIRDDILKITKEILEHIEIIYTENKIDTSEYNEFAVIIANLTTYLCQEVDKLDSIEEEVSNLVKTFYDPEVEKRGILNNQREVILEFLEDVGIISDDIKNLVQKENNIEILKKWLKLAARAQSIDEFRNKVGLH